MRLSFSVLGLPEIRAPKNITSETANKFLVKHHGWIKTHQQQPINFTHGTKVIDYHINHLNSQSETSLTVSHKQKMILVSGSEVEFKSAEIQHRLWLVAAQALTRQVKAELIRLATLIATQNGLQPSDVRVRAMRSRWGSCSGKGIITLSSFLIYLPKELQVYVIKHELAHLKYQHHQQRFWQFVEKIEPNYSNLRKQLRQHRTNFDLVSN